MGASVLQETVEDLVFGISVVDTIDSDPRNVLMVGIGVLGSLVSEGHAFIRVGAGHEGREIDSDFGTAGGDSVTPVSVDVDLGFEADHDGLSGLLFNMGLEAVFDGISQAFVGSVLAGEDVLVTRLLFSGVSERNDGNVGELFDSISLKSSSEAASDEIFAVWAERLSQDDNLEWLGLEWFSNNLDRWSEAHGGGNSE